MKIKNLKDFTRGWVVGNFEPSLFKTDGFELAIKTFQEGESEQKHFHKLTTEYTIVISGEIKMNGKFFSNGSIIILQPNEHSFFEAITDATLVCFRDGSFKDDKYMVEE